MKTATETAAPSRSALRVALRRAAHQIYDRPLVFADPLAVPILGPAMAEELKRTPQRSDRPYSVGMRAFLVARSRYAEDQLAFAVRRGLTQYVLLGAGLDTFAYRNPYPLLRVFEVDRPATQAWKRGLLAASGMAVPDSLRFVPADFERRTLGQQLAEAGYDAGTPALFAWLGVVPYLTPAAFRETVNLLAAQRAGSGVVLDYAQPRHVLPPNEQLALDSQAARGKQSGEPWQLFFTPDAIRDQLEGFETMEDLGAAEINERYFAGRSDALRMHGASGRILSAWCRPVV